MSCKFDKEILQRYIDNEADPLEIIFLREHMKYCMDCKREVELLTLTDQKLYQVINEVSLPFNLDALTEKLVDNCIEETVNRSVLGKLAHDGYKMSKSVARNASRFVRYIPGSKLAAKGINASAEYIGNSTKRYIKGKVKSLIPILFRG